MPVLTTYTPPARGLGGLNYLCYLYIMGTFHPEDIFIDSLSFELHKRSSYVNCQGFKNKTAVGFKPLRGLFSQVRYLPLKYMGNLTIELEIVTNATNCINDRSQTFKRYRKKIEPARIFRKFSRHQVTKTRAGANFPIKPK